MSWTSTTSPINTCIAYVQPHLLPAQYSKKWHIFICLIIWKSCIFVLPFINSTFLHYRYITFNTVWSKIILCCKNTYTLSFTHSYIYVFLPRGLMYKSTSKLTNVTHPRYFILNELFYTHKTSPCNIKEKYLQKVSWFKSPTSVLLFQFILTSSEPTLSRGLEVGQLQYVHTLYQYPTWSNLLLANLWLKMTSSRYDSVCLLYPWSYFCAKHSAHCLVFFSRYILISLEKLHPVLTNYGRSNL